MGLPHPLPRLAVSLEQGFPQGQEEHGSEATLGRSLADQRTQLRGRVVLPLAFTTDELTDALGRAGLVSCPPGALCFVLLEFGPISVSSVVSNPQNMGHPLLGEPLSPLLNWTVRWVAVSLITHLQG